MTLLACFAYMLVKKQKQKAFDSYYEYHFNNFNKDRVNPISKESFMDFFKMEHGTINFLGQSLSLPIESANHRNGDELIENTSRCAKKRIKDHLHISTCSKSHIVNLGYNFKNKKNLISFVSLLNEVLPSEGKYFIAFPINKTWFIYQKDGDKIGMSYKTHLLNSKG